MKGEMIIMEKKFKIGDRVRYTGESCKYYPIQDKEYNIVSEGAYCPLSGGGYYPGDYEYDIVPASGNDDPVKKYNDVEQKDLTLVNPSRIIFG